MLLLDLLYERARELRDFILLPWEDKKKLIRELWHKYGKLYIILFVLCIIVAFINVYIEWSSNNTKYVAIGVQKQIGGTDPSEQTKPGNTKAENTKAGNITIINQPFTNTTNTKEINTENITNDVDTTNIANNSNSDIGSKRKAIKERRLAKQSARPHTSLSDTLGSVGNNLSSAMTGGVGKALSVLGTFFSAIIGFILFCAAPVVIFYMWMKKLILPLFPTR